MGLAKTEHDTARLGYKAQQLKVGEGGEHVNRRSEPLPHQNEQVGGLLGLRRDNLNLTEVAQSFSGEWIYGLLFVGEDLHVAATGLQKVGGVFREAADENVKISVAQQVGGMAAVRYPVLVGSREHQRLIALEQV